jgi:hypothetical protein
MRHYKSKNILIGIAIILTTLLLFVIPSIGKDMVEVNFAVINKIYPTWHALYRNVDESTVMKLAAHHDVKTYGLRSDAGYMNLEDATVSMMYMDRTGMELYKVKLKEGQLPQKENDIVVSKGILEALGQNGKIGDTITVPYQILKDDGLDYTKEKDFRICGFLADNESSKEQKQYTSLVSEAFLKAEIPVEQVKYRFLLQVNGQKGNTTADYTETIQNIARQFGISEDDMNINKEYLAANYVDPATIPVIVGIMLIVVLAGSAIREKQARHGRAMAGGGARWVYFSATGTATNSVLPSRIRRSARVSPALAAATCSRNCSALVSVLLLTPTITSPGCTPARAARPCTRCTIRP